LKRIAKVREDKCGPAGDELKHVGTQVPGSSVHALRQVDKQIKFATNSHLQVALKPLRLDQLAAVEKRVFDSGYWNWSDIKEKKEKPPHGRAKYVEMVRIFVTGTDMELLDLEDKVGTDVEWRRRHDSLQIHNRHHYTVHVHLWRKKAKAG
jgi:hypothetical protein